MSVLVGGWRGGSGPSGEVVGVYGLGFRVAEVTNLERRWPMVSPGIGQPQ